MRLYSPKRKRERERVKRNVDKDNTEDNLIRGDSCMVDESGTIMIRQRLPVKRIALLVDLFCLSEGDRTKQLSHLSHDFEFFIKISLEIIRKASLKLSHSTDIDVTFSLQKSSESIHLLLTSRDFCI